MDDSRYSIALCKVPAGLDGSVEDRRFEYTVLLAAFSRRSGAGDSVLAFRAASAGSNPPTACFLLLFYFF